LFRRVDGGTLPSGSGEGGRNKLHEGTTFGMPHEQEWELAEEICARYPVDGEVWIERHGSNNACLPYCARRDRPRQNHQVRRVVHGLQTLLSGQREAEGNGIWQWKTRRTPSWRRRSAGSGRRQRRGGQLQQFQECRETASKQFPGQIAAIILEPIMMNVGLWHSGACFLEGLRKLCDANGALLIFDEVKTGAKLAWGGASDYFGVSRT